MNKVNHPFWVIVNKEISDHVKSWRFIILIGIIALTCMGSLYTALTNIGEAIKPNDPDGSFLFLKLFTVSDGTLPSFVLFINFLGPLLGIALGFDAVNSEQNKGTLSRMLSQPIHRDCIINAKFVAAPCFGYGNGIGVYFNRRWHWGNGVLGFSLFRLAVFIHLFEYSHKNDACYQEKFQKIFHCASHLNSYPPKVGILSGLN